VTSYLKKPFTKIGLVEWLKMNSSPEFKPQYHKKKIPPCRLGV
jgi:hypothetical protein